MWFFVSGIDSLPYSGSEDEEDDETASNSISSSTKHHLITGLHGGGPGSILPPTTPEANNNSLSAGDLQAPHSALDLKEDSEDQGKKYLNINKCVVHILRSHVAIKIVIIKTRIQFREMVYFF